MKFVHIASKMSKSSHFFRAFLFVSLVLVSAWAVADKLPTRRLLGDTLTVASATSWGEMSSSRMAQSLYPVQLKVKGRSLRVVSKYEQVLPIYTRSGTLYLAMQLNPGVNWLNGQPRGRYRINTRTINIK